MGSRRQEIKEHKPRGVQLTRTSDPLMMGVPLPHRAVLFPYGFPLRIQSNSPLILEMAMENWQHMRKLFDVKPIDVRCLVGESKTSRKTLPDPVFRAQRNLFTITADAWNFASCDLSTGFGFAWFTPAAMAERDYVRYIFLNGMVTTLIEALYTLSIHAACVARDGRGILLAGPSGAGKTSLSYACALRGWSYISDDASVLVRGPGKTTVVGDPLRFRFRETAGKVFPEFRGVRNTTRRPQNGKPTVEVRTDSLPNIRTAAEGEVAKIVFLKRHSDPRGSTKLIPFHDRDEAARRLFDHVWPEDLPSHQERLEALQSLLVLDMFELHYCDLDRAVDALDALASGPCRV